VSANRHPSPKSISGVLLAGGESRRMGRDKATMHWRGRPLWEWQIEKLRALRPEKIFLSARSDVPWRPVDVELLRDAPPSRGPLSGLAVALASIQTDHLLALAVDMPFMTTENLRTLCSLVTKGIGVIPMIDGKAEPLGAIYPKEAAPLFQDALRGDNFSLQPLVRKSIALNMLREMPISDQARDFYKSINEPADLS
jgi:molybdopterin-guanine dinucleotide biosynthesis protein A